MLGVWSKHRSVLSTQCLVCDINTLNTGQYSVLGVWYKHIPGERACVKAIWAQWLDPAWGCHHQLGPAPPPVQTHPPPPATPRQHAGHKSWKRRFTKCSKSNTRSFTWLYKVVVVGRGAFSMWNFKLREGWIPALLATPSLLELRLHIFVSRNAEEDMLYSIFSFILYVSCVCCVKI